MHKIELKTGPGGFFTDIVCPEDCDEKEVHQDQYSDVGLELITYAEEDTALASFEVKPEWTGRGEDAEFWLRPVVADE